MPKDFWQPQSIVEILALTVLFYFILNFVRGTRAASVLKGLVFFFVVAFIGVMHIADVFQLYRIKQMLQWLLAGSSIALIVIFAPEMRRALAGLSRSSLLSPLVTPAPEKVVRILVDAARLLSKNRIGMLVAIEREIGLGEYIEQGVVLNADLSVDFLQALFHPGAPLHDGAVILQGGRVAAAGCLFPLSDNPAISTALGTRHRAAIGISENSDAVAVVVSEETGRISVATAGRITLDLSPETLEQTLRELYVRSPRKLA